MKCRNAPRNLREHEKYRSPARIRAGREPPPKPASNRATLTPPSRPRSLEPFPFRWKRPSSSARVHFRGEPDPPENALEPALRNVAVVTGRPYATCQAL